MRISNRGCDNGSFFCWSGTGLGEWGWGLNIYNSGVEIGVGIVLLAKWCGEGRDGRVGMGFCRSGRFGVWRGLIPYFFAIFFLPTRNTTNFELTYQIYIRSK